jgi:hypothetical protein
MSSTATFFVVRLTDGTSGIAEEWRCKFQAFRSGNGYE